MRPNRAVADAVAYHHRPKTVTKRIEGAGAHATAPAIGSHS
jgi:hypothetical protein